MKYCCVSHCRNDSTNNDDDEGKVFYELPLQEPDRLQQWLKNMGREDWTPSEHEYICHEHFTPSCFKVQQGIRCLEEDAVPTVFKAPAKRKGKAQSPKKAKRLRGNTTVRTPTAAADDGTQPAAATAPPDGGSSSSIAVEPHHDFGDDTVVDFLRTDPHPLPPPSVDYSFDTGAEEDVPGEDTAAVVVVSQRTGEVEEDELLSGITAAILAQHSGLVVSDSLTLTGHPVDAALCVENVTPDMEELSIVPGGGDHVAYFETIPHVLPCTAPSPMSMPPCAVISPETVLSSALSNTPIASTLPIVSKHLPSPSSPTLFVAVETQPLDIGGETPDDPVEGSAEQQETQLEEHCLLRMPTPWRTPTR